jgi:RNA polymerase sigma-70 factor (ECF subfamily)
MEARDPYERALAELTNRLVAGDSEVLAGILRLLGGRTQRAIRRRLRGMLNEADYDDVLSIALFRLWQRRDYFDPKRSRLDQWFYVVARNAAIDLLRARRLRPEETMGDRVERVAAPTQSVKSLIEPSRARRDLERALKEVSELDRRILLSGLTETELSLELGLKPGAIRVRRLRSKRKLRYLLRQMDSLRRGE